MARERHSPKPKSPVVLETLAGEKTPGQIAKQYGIHPNPVALLEKKPLERGPEVFLPMTTWSRRPKIKLRPLQKEVLVPLQRQWCFSWLFVRTPAGHLA